MFPGRFLWILRYQDGFSLFQVGFYGYSWFKVSLSWFQVGFNGFSQFQVGFSWFQVGLFVCYEPRHGQLCSIIERRSVVGCFHHLVLGSPTLVRSLKWFLNCPFSKPAQSKGFDSLGQLFIDRQVAAIENANSNKYGTNTKQIQVALKENEDSNPEFKRVLAERAKRLERVSNVTEILIHIHNK